MSIIDDIIRREGSVYTNRPDDRGGPTKYGVTIGKLREWRKMPVLPIDVENLTEQEARDIYRIEYVAPWGFIAHPRLREFLIDSGVNHGVGRAKMLLQRALGVTEDANIGPVTTSALANIDGETLRSRVIAERMKYYGRIVDAEYEVLRKQGKIPPMQAANIEGWLNRLAEFLY